MHGSLKGFFFSHRRIAFLLVVVLVVALITGVYAYLVSLSPPRGPRVSITSSPLEFSMELDKTDYLFGENITITFCLRSISNQTIQVTWPYMVPPNDEDRLVTETSGADIPSASQLLNLLHFDFAVTNSNGTKVFQMDGGGFTMGYTINFEPNGSLMQTFAWNYTASYLTPDLMLSRGTYQIRGICYGSILHGIATLETPSITFTIK